LCQAIQRVKELAVSIEGKSLEEKKSLLDKCAATTLSSKLIGGEKEFFATMVVDAVLAIGHDDRLNLIGIKKVISFNGDFSRILSFSSIHSKLSLLTC
jgi:T-complex protein 1 subunit eta